MSKNKVKGKKKVESLQSDDDINKYGLGGTIGRGIAAASNFVLPGLGTVLNPVLGGIGDKIDENKMIKDQRNQQFSTIREVDNPYNYNNGGPITPTTQESTKVAQPLINYNDNRTMQTFQPSAFQRFINTVRGEKVTREYNRLVGENNAAVDHYNRVIHNQGIADKPAFQPLPTMSGGASGTYGKGGSLDYSTGGVLKGKLDFATYYGRKHKNGGIATDKNGNANPNKVNEIEGDETRLSIGDSNYVFSDQLTI